MKKLPHDKYFSVVDNYSRNQIDKQTFNLLVQKAKKNNDIHFYNFLKRLANNQLDPYQHLTDSHYLMANHFKENPTVFIMERDLSIALLNSKFSVNIEDINFKSRQFVIYFNLKYEDFGFPSIDEFYEYHCAFCKITETDTHFIFTICSISRNKKNQKGPIDDIAGLENSTFSHLSVKKGLKFNRSFLDEEKADVVKNYNYVGDGDYVKAVPDGSWDYDIKAAIYNLIISMHLYLSHDDSDFEIHRPEITSKDIDKIKNPKKKRKAEKRLEEIVNYDVQYIGKKYVAKLNSSSAELGIRKEQKYSYEVQGFFNSYWYGKRTDKFGNKIPGQYKKIKWIEPQIRNKHLPQKLSKGKIYKVR